MVLVHKVVPSRVRPAAGAGRAVSRPVTRPRSTDRRARRELTTALRHHHAAERDLLWHRLRRPGAARRGLPGRHARTAPPDLRAARRAGRPAAPVGAAADADLRAVLVDILTELAGAVAAHLDAVGAARPAGRRRTLLRARMARAGAARRELDPAAPDGLDARRDAGGRHRRRTRNLLAKVPGPARLLYRMVGQEQYIREMSELRGAAGLSRTARSPMRHARPARCGKSVLACASAVKNLAAGTNSPLLDWIRRSAAGVREPTHAASSPTTTVLGSTEDRRAARR